MATGLLTCSAAPPFGKVISKKGAPNESWIKQYTKQATAKLIAGLNQFARTCALAVADAGVSSP